MYGHSPESFTPRRKLSYTVVTSGYCRVTISVVSVVLLAPSVPWEKGCCTPNSSLQTKSTETEEGGQGWGAIGLDVLVVACHLVLQILTQFKHTSRKFRQCLLPGSIIRYDKAQFSTSDTQKDRPKNGYGKMTCFGLKKRNILGNESNDTSKPIMPV